MYVSRYGSRAKNFHLVEGVKGKGYDRREYVIKSGKDNDDIKLNLPEIKQKKGMESDKKIKKIERKQADLEASFKAHADNHAKDHVKVTKKIAYVERAAEKHDKKLNNHGLKIAGLEESKGVQSREIENIKAKHAEGIRKHEHRVTHHDAMHVSHLQELAKSREEIEQISAKLEDHAKKLSEMPREAAKKIFSSPELLTEAVKELNKVISSKENKKIFQEVLKDSEIRDLFIDICAMSEDEKIKRNPYFKNLLDKVRDKIDPTRPKAWVDIPSSLIATMFISITLLILAYLYNLSTAKQLKIPHDIGFKDVDLETLNTPPELIQLVKDSQDIIRQIDDLDSAWHGMNEYGSLLYELNPVTGHTDWIEKGLTYYKNPENNGYLKKVESHIDHKDGYFTKMKSFIEIGNISTDPGKAVRGLLAEQMRLTALAQKNQDAIEEYDNNLRNSHLELKQKVSKKLSDKRDSNGINESLADEFERKLKDLSEIGPDDNSLKIYNINKHLEEMHKELDKNMYDSSAPDGGTMCTIF